MPSLFLCLSVWRWYIQCTNVFFNWFDSDLTQYFKSYIAQDHFMIQSREIYILQSSTFFCIRGWLGHDRMVVGFTTTSAISAYRHYVASSNPVHGEAIQHYVTKLVSDLRQVGGFPRFPTSIKLTATIYLKYCWKWC